MKRPRIGDIVHFVMLSGDHLPAIVTAVFGSKSLDLVVFLSSVQSRGLNNCERKTMVGHEEATLSKSGTWHWPEPDNEEHGRVSEKDSNGI